MLGVLLVYHKARNISGIQIFVDFAGAFSINIKNLTVSILILRELTSKPSTFVPGNYILGYFLPIHKNFLPLWYWYQSLAKPISSAQTFTRSML